MEVKEIVGLGTTIDVLVVNGRIKEGDTIIVGGVEGPIITQVENGYRADVRTVKYSDKSTRP